MPEATISALASFAFGEVVHIKCVVPWKIKLLPPAEGRAENLKCVPTLPKGQGCGQNVRLMPSIVGKEKTNSAAQQIVFSLSFLRLLNSFFLCFNFYFFVQWLAAASQLTDGWFPLATWGFLSPSKFLSRAVSRAKLLASAVLSKAWSGKLAMQIFVHFISSMSACWQSSRCLRHVPSALPVPKGQRCHLLCETQVGPWSLVCRGYPLCNVEYNNDLVHFSPSECFAVVIYWFHCRWWQLIFCSFPFLQLVCRKLFCGFQSWSLTNSCFYSKHKALHFTSIYWSWCIPDNEMMAVGAIKMSLPGLLDAEFIESVFNLLENGEMSHYLQW